MPANLFKLQGRIRSILTGLVVALSASACAPDMFQLGTSTQLDNFLDKVVKSCGRMYINEYEVWQLADADETGLAGQESYFLDQASMLLYGTISPGKWRRDIAAYFDDESPRGMKTYQCIIDQLPAQNPPLPNAYKEVFKVAPQTSGND